MGLSRIVAYFVRHGSTTLNDSGRFRGNIDVSLDENGIHDARKLAEFFQNIKLGNAYSSPLQRALQTSDIVLKSHDIYPAITESLKPIDVGELAGKKKSEHLKEIKEFQAHPNKPIKGGESINEFNRRTRPPILNAIRDGVEMQHPSITFGHSSIIHAIGHVIYQDHNKVLVKPGGVVAVSFDGHTFDSKAILHPKLKDEGFIA